LNLYRASSYLFAASTAALVINNLVGFGLIRLLSPAEYGYIAYFIGMFAFSRLLATMRLDPFMIEQLARAAESQDRAGLHSILQTFGGMRLAVGLSLMLGLGLVAVLRQDAIFAWVGLTTLAAGLFDYTLAIVQGLQRYTWMIGHYLGQSLLYLLGCGLLWVSNTLRPDTVYAAFAMSFGLPMLAALVWILWRWHDKWAFSLAYLRRALPMIMALFAVGILNQIYLSQGTFLTGSFGFIDDAAYFGTAFSLVGLPLNIGFAIASSTYYPDIVRAHQRGDTAHIQQTTDHFLRVFSLLLLIPSVVAGAYNDLIIRFLYTSAYEGSMLPFSVMSPLIVILFLQQIAIFLLYAHHKAAWAVQAMGLQAFISVVGTVVGMAIYPHQAAVGAALASVGGALAGTALLYRYCRCLLPLQYRLWKALLVLCLFYAVAFASRLLFNALLPAS
jgi:O-antigen/teichoic acid export membrane protein